MIGCLSSSNFCSSTAPRPVPEASVCNINLPEKSGLLNTESLQIQVFNLSKAFCVCSDHFTLFEAIFFIRSVRCVVMSENFAINFLLKPSKPRNYLTCFFVNGTGNSLIADTLSCTGFIFLLPVRCPKISSSPKPKEHLHDLATSLACLSASNTVLCDTPNSH